MAWTPDQQKYIAGLGKMAPKPAATGSWTPDQQKYIAGLGGKKKKAAVTPLGMPAGQMAAFKGAKNAANASYKTQLAQNTYNRGQTGAQYGIQQRDLVQQFKQMREQMPYDYNQGGMMHSGLRLQGLQDYAQDRQRTMGDFQTTRQGAMGQFDLQRQELERQRQEALAQIEMQKQALMAQYSSGAFGKAK